MSSGDGTCLEGRPTWLAEPERAAGSTSQALEWAPFLPSIWRTERIKALARREKGAFTDGDWVETRYITDSGIRLIQTGNIGTGHFKEQGFRFISTESFKALRCTRVEPGDVLVCRLAAPVGRACLAPDLSTSMITSVDVCILKTRDDVDARYVVYTLSAQTFLDWVESTCRGSTRDRISRQMLGSMRLPLPLHSRQVLIADFLDRETEKIDALVAKKRRLIELLEEKRTALISHVVTKGLDPDVTMKDSGAGWLGKLPGHWTLSPLMRLVDPARPIMYGIVLPGPDFPGGVPIIKGGDVSLERLALPLLNRTDPAIEMRYVRSRLAGGDVVYAIRGSIGAAAVVPDALKGANLTQDTARVAPRAGVDVGWLMFALQSSPVFAQLEAGAVGATIRGINIFSLKRAVLPVPPQGEQVAIRQFLGLQTAKLDTLLESVLEAVVRLREYRSALITAAVTGQIDVREHAKAAS